jgi:hypothetical protein
MTAGEKPYTVTKQVSRMGRFYDLHMDGQLIGTISASRFGTFSAYNPDDTPISEDTNRAGGHWPTPTEFATFDEAAAALGAKA